ATVKDSRPNFPHKLRHNPSFSLFSIESLTKYIKDKFKNNKAYGPDGFGRK
ncbi:Hypothetical protein FKW44_008759, partial [Caligus rogercresseyi]